RGLLVRGLRAAPCAPLCFAEPLRCVFFFFFQAEDGIRDRNVTGVQTCALPISLSSTASSRLSNPFSSFSSPPTRRMRETCFPARSEERRVGKECRSRGAREH